MRLSMRASQQTEPTNGEWHLVLGAAVVRPAAGGVVLEFGPADGAPQAKLHLSEAEAKRFGLAVRSVATNGGEVVILAEP